MINELIHKLPSMHSVYFKAPSVFLSDIETSIDGFIFLCNLHRSPVIPL